MSSETLKIALCVGVSRVLTLVTPEPITYIDVQEGSTDDLLVVVEVNSSYFANMIVHLNNAVTMSAEAADIVATVEVAAE